MKEAIEKLKINLEANLNVVSETIVKNPLRTFGERRGKIFMEAVINLRNLDFLSLERVEASQAAQRATNAEDMAQAIWENDSFQDGLEMIRDARKEEQFTACTTILQAIKSELEATKESRDAGKGVTR